MQNINRSNRLTDMDDKWVHEPLLYLNLWTEWKSGKSYKNLIYEIAKDSTLKQCTCLERTEKILWNNINGIKISRFNSELPALKQGKKCKIKCQPK